MAGAGYKLFNTGDVLTAAQVNTYLQEQAVMRFANAAARTTALSGVLAEGMVSYLMDTDSVEVYNGTSWVGVATGDITGVTAGTGLSGGGTSGDVTLSLSTPVSATNGGTAQTTYATGDLLYASASNTLAKRAIGTTGQVLTVSGGVPTWATPASGGSMTLIETLTLSGSSVTSSTLPTSYRNLYIEASGYFASAEVFFGMRLNSDSGTNYTEWSTRWQTSGTNFGPSGSNTTRVGMIDPNDIGLPTSNKYNVSIAYIFGYNDTDKYKLSKVWNHHMNNSNVSGSTNLVSTWRNNAAVTTLNFYLGSGTFSGGTVKIYGVN